MSRISLLWLLFVGLSWQKDPLNDFCRRFGHQSTVVDSKLYIDGGVVNWNPISQNPSNITNSWLLYNDLTTSPVGVGVPQLYANLSKNASIQDVEGGFLWADEVNKRFYLYGGDYFNGNTPNSPTLLSYDIIYNQWESFGPTGTNINSVSWGGGVGISELGQGYVYGGWASNNSMPNWIGEPLATSYLLKYQMDTGVWTNNTGPDSIPRAEGVMVYIPASSNGLLVYFGGLEQPWGNSTTVSSPMNKIFIYDIASSKWYSQTAGGDVPADRRRFCAGSAWAPDQSSYNIYLYGGLGFGANETGFDDVYILSLPSFQWIKWWEGSGTGNPHNSLTCNVVNGGQMLVIGGTFPLSNTCDSPPTWGTHNLDLGKQSGRMWADYHLNTTSYVVPPEIISAVGGSSLGGATATAPAGGFDNSDLSVYFVQQATVASRSPTRAIPTPTNTTSSLPTNTPTPHKGLSTGAIIGIAVAGTSALFTFLFIGGCCLIRCHRNKNIPKSPTTQEEIIHYSTTPQSPYSNHSQPVERHQLEDHCIPAELAASTHQLSPKEFMMQQVNEREHPVYHNARWVEVNPPSPSPVGVSPRSVHSLYSPSYSPVTDITTPTDIRTTPSYHNARRSPRQVPLQNQTYYSA